MGHASVAALNAFHSAGLSACTDAADNPSLRSVPDKQALFCSL